MQDIQDSGEQRSDPYRQNWSENIQYSSNTVLLPQNIHEV